MNRYINKYLFIFLPILLCGLVFSSCSEEIPNSTFLNKDTVTFELKLLMPVSARSATEVDGSANKAPSTENGYVNENKLEYVNLYFAKVDPEFPEPINDKIIYNLTNIKEIYSEDTNGGDKKTLKIKKTVNIEEVAHVLAGNKLRLYVVGNYPSGAIKSHSSSLISYDDIIFWEEEGSEGSILPLINASPSGIMDFSNLETSDISALFSMVESYNLSETFSNTSQIGSFGKIPLERGYARLDFKDSSPNASTHAFVYPLGKSNLNLKVVKMAPVNVSKKEYLFRHSISGTNEEASLSKKDMELFGVENLYGDFEKEDDYTWICDYDWEEKTMSNSLSDCLNSPNTLKEKEWTIIEGKRFNEIDYNPWCYVSENTVPCITKMIQGLTTGIAFQVMLCDEKGEKIHKTQLLNSDIWDGQLNFEEKNGKIHVSEFSGRTVELEGDDEEGYLLTYYYWIRHNEMEKNTNRQDPMEFAVVRNNIYKISITKFNHLPFPYDSSGKCEQTQSDPEREDIEVKTGIKSWNYVPILEKF